MRTLLGLLTVVVATGFANVNGYAEEADKGEKKVDQRVFEMRIYYAAPGDWVASFAAFGVGTTGIQRADGGELSSAVEYTATVRSSSDALRS